MLIFSKNKHVGVERVGSNRIKISVMVMDTFYMGRVDMMVDIDNLTILKIEGMVERSPAERCKDAISRLRDIEGIGIKKGVTKVVDTKVGGRDGCTKLANMVLEGCHAAVPISYFLKGGRRGDLKGREAFLSRYPWLVNSCIILSKDSPLMKGKDVDLSKE